MMEYVPLATVTKLNCSNKYKTQAFGQDWYSSKAINSIL